MAKKKPAGKGRPAGSKNKPREVVEAVVQPCPQCGRTEGRKAERIAREVEQAGERPNGIAYTNIIWRAKVCPCGQHLREISYENRGQ